MINSDIDKDKKKIAVLWVCNNCGMRNSLKNSTCLKCNLKRKTENFERHTMIESDEKTCLKKNKGGK
jgi:hypothetical protein